MQRVLTAAALETRITIPRSPSGPSGLTRMRCLSARRVRLNVPVRLTAMARSHKSSEWGVPSEFTIYKTHPDQNALEVRSWCAPHLCSPTDACAIDDAPQRGRGLQCPFHSLVHGLLNIVDICDVEFEEPDVTARRKVGGRVIPVEDRDVSRSRQKISDGRQTQARRAEIIGQCVR
jgi:hypothetical protein